MLEIGEIVDGTVKSVMKFGAFVELENGSTGLVHISEVSNSFVKDINDYVKTGDSVKAKVLEIEDDKISLSMKQTEPPKPKEKIEVKYEDLSFEDKLQKFMKESNTKYEQKRSRQNSKYGRSKSRR